MPDRAMVAISEDRQWLVVHYKGGRIRHLHQARLWYG